MHLRLILPLTLLAALLSTAAPASAAGKSVYLSVGDSLAWGYSKAKDGAVVQSGRDYSALLTANARRSGRYSRRLKLYRLGCPGETTVTYRFGGRCKYAGFRSQSAAVTRFLRVNRRHVAFVTISLGSNSYAECVRGLDVDMTCLESARARHKRDLGPILRNLRRAAGKRTRIAIATHHDPYLALYLHGGEHRDRALQTVELIDRGNEDIHWEAADPRVDIRVADVFRAFRTDALTRTVTVRGQKMPLAVWRSCTLTLMCHAEPVGPDIHPTAAGYRTIARTFARALGMRWRVSR